MHSKFRKNLSRRRGAAEKNAEQSAPYIGFAGIMQQKCLTGPPLQATLRGIFNRENAWIVRDRCGAVMQSRIAGLLSRQMGRTKVAFKSVVVA